MRGRVSAQLITHEGKTQSVRLWAKDKGLKSSLIYKRTKLGLTGDKLFTPPKDLKSIIYKGKTRTISELAEEKGVPIANVRTRLWMGWTIEESLDTPIKKVKRRVRSEIEQEEGTESETVRMICFYNLHKTISKLRKDFKENIPYYLEPNFGKQNIKAEPLKKHWENPRSFERVTSDGRY